MARVAIYDPGRIGRATLKLILEAEPTAILGHVRRLLAGERR